MKTLFVLYLHLCAIKLFPTAEIITLTKEKNVVCVATQATANSAIYVNPPIKSDFIEQRAEINNWINDDWRLTNSCTSFHNTITDKRWEAFKIYNEDDGYSLQENPLSFSVYTNGSIIFKIYSFRFSNSAILNFQANENNPSGNDQTCRWIHYSVLKENNTIKFYSGDQVIKTYKVDFNPYWMYLDSSCSNETFWKLHKYYFRSSETSTVNNRSYVDVTFTDNLCLSMYVSVDKDCFLEITLESNNKTNTANVLGFNERGLFKKWKRVEIKADSAGKGKLSFFKGYMQNKKHGYWAVDDIKFCNKDIETYQTHLPSDASKKEHVCEILSQPNEPSFDSTSSILYCDKPDFLGTGCNISCSTALGKSYPYCENHKICQGKLMCFCSWGYQLPSCEKTCERGKWGLFCMKECPFNCKNCHPATGKCLEKIIRNSPPIRSLAPEDFNLSKNELPTKITLSSHKIYVELPEFKKNHGNITYNFRYLCVSEWCTNQTVREEKILIISSFDYNHSIIQNFENLMPFTDYQPIVIAHRANQTIEKKYSTVRVQSGLDNIKNVSVYSSNDTNLWIRFRPSLNSMLIYTIWYHQQNSLQPPVNITSITQCELWNDFLCGMITNLKNNTAYSIIVEDTNLRRFSNNITGFTSQKAPDAPENLKIGWSSDEDLTLTWDSPLFTNGPLQYFGVEVEEHGVTKHKKISIKKRQKTYEYKIPLKHDSNYSFSVYAVNKYPSEKNSINVVISSPNSKWFSPKPMVETCSSTCQLLIPKPKEFTYSDYHILVIHNDEVKNDEENKVLEIFKSLKERTSQNEKQWIVSEIQEKDGFLQVEIGKEPGKAVSLYTHGEYTMYLILSIDNNYKVHPLSLKNKKKIAEAKILPYILTTVFLVFLLVALFLVLLLLASLHSLKRKNYFSKNKKMKGQFSSISVVKNESIYQNVNMKERIMLLPSVDFVENETNIKLGHLEFYVKKALTKGKDIINQFHSLSDNKNKTCFIGTHINNVNKNKDEYNIPYDETRVILKSMDGMGNDDYINANYIDGFDRPRAYIATQGPKFSTVKDFWRMVWQEQTETIIMATNFIENKKRKCAEYWPQRLNANSECGEMIIKLTSEEIYEHYDCRIFKICYKGYSRKVRHFHLKWNPDNLTPFYPNNVVPLVKRIREISENSESYIPPIVIHCSSGVNRTGTLILCDLALQMAKTENSINFYKLLKNMREQRPNMVKSEKQYILAHLIVLECLMEQENVFKKSIKENLGFGVIKRQLNYLDRLHWHDTAVQFGMPQTNNTYYHSYTQLPVDGYGKIKKYLIMQQPTEQFITEFWNTVINEKIDCILFLQKSNQKEKTEPWPHSMVNSKIVTSVIEIKSIKSDYCTFSQLLLSRCDEVANSVIYRNEIFFFQMNGWNQREPVPSSTNNLLNIVDDISNIYRGQRPILVACHDGATACGLFTTLSYAVEKCQKELKVDICNAVRTVRRSGAPFLNSKIQMEFLYQAVMEYQRNFDSYACIE